MEWRNLRARQRLNYHARNNGLLAAQLGDLVERTVEGIQAEQNQVC